MENPKILLIEDDPDLIKIYKEAFASAGYDLVIAKDGKEGLEKVNEGGYSLILLDIVLPKLDGLAFLTHLKENPAKEKNGLIVILTNLTFDEKLEKYKELGAIDCLSKIDYTPHQLIEKVKTYIN